MLSLVALVSLLRLRPYGSGKTNAAKANHLSDFLSLLKGSPSSNTRTTLDHVIWTFWIVVSSRVDATEGQKRFQLLTHVLDTTPIPDGSDKDLVRYWKGRFIPSRCHDQALSTIPDTLEKLALPVKSVLLAHDQTSTPIELEVVSDNLAQAGGNESSHNLVQRTQEKFIKRNRCCGWR